MLPSMTIMDVERCRGCGASREIDEPNPCYRCAGQAARAKLNAELVTPMNDAELCEFLSLVRRTPKIAHMARRLVNEVRSGRSAS